MTVATFALGAAGSALAGSVGRALGSEFGRQIDRELRPSNRRRISDVRLQTSQYGDTICSVIGTMRVAGVVIWSSEPVRTTVVSKSTSTASFNISFAVALSCRPVRSVKRIWADGRLIRDAEGRQNIAFALRLHGGMPDQAPDELIEALTASPAYRDLSYVVFEDFDLSTFGNRVPHLTFEIVAEGEDQSLADLVSGELQTAVASQVIQYPVRGFALCESEKVEPLASLSELAGLAFGYDGSTWSMGSAGELHVIDGPLMADLAANATSNRKADVGGMSLRYFDPELAFAVDEKHSRALVKADEDRVDLSAALTSQTAKQLVEDRRLRLVQDDAAITLQLPLSYAVIQVGDVVENNATDHRYLVKRKEIDGLEVRLFLRETRARTGLVAADPASRPAETFGDNPLRIELRELPALGLSSQPSVGLFVGGGVRPWRSVLVSFENCDRMVRVASASEPAIIGVLMAPLSAAGSELFDQANDIVVSFDEDPFLVSCSDDALLAGENLISIDGEMIQFGSAAHLGNASYRLSKLLRGRAGTEQREMHPSASTVLVHRGGTFTTLPLSSVSVGSRVVARTNDLHSNEVACTVDVSGRAQQPWAPAHLRVEDQGTSIKATWVRCGRHGLIWPDGTDAPVGEEREAYLVTVSDEQGNQVRHEVPFPEASLSQSLLQQLGPRPWSFEVRQLGSFAIGLPQSVILT